MVQQYMHIYLHNNKTTETTDCTFIVFIYREEWIKSSLSINHTELEFHLSNILAAMTAQNVTDFR